MKNQPSLFETHFHPDPDTLPEDYINQSIDAGVQYLLAVGSNMDSSLLSESFADQFENVWFSAGVHPHEASQYLEDVQSFAKFAKNRKCAAIGEIGLDYFYENSERDAQLELFEKFLKLSLDFNLPAIVHCRDKDGFEQAYIDAFLILKNFSKNGGRFVIHCYTGSVEWADKFLDIGAYLGITGIVTFPKAQNVRDVLKVIPDDRLLIETDTPYLAPVPKRGKKNHTKYLPYIAEYIAAEKGVALQKIAEMTTLNAKQLFEKV